MVTVLIYSKASARVELQGILSGLGFAASHLVLRYDGTSLKVQFKLVASIFIPVDAINKQNTPYRLKNFSDLQKDAALIADYRAALHALAKIQLVHTGDFLGVQHTVLGTTQLFLELELNALLDPGKGNVDVSGRLLLEAQVRLQCISLDIPREQPSKQDFSFNWQLAVLFSAQFEVEVTFPTLQFSLPKLPLLEELNLLKLKWDRPSQNWILPKWFESVNVPVRVESTDFNASFDTSGFVLKARTIEATYAGTIVVRADTVEINSDRAKDSKAESIKFISLQLDTLEVKQPLGLPLSIKAGPICVTPFLDTGEIALKVILDVVSLSETTGSSLRFEPVSFLVKSEGISNFKAALVDGTASLDNLLFNEKPVRSTGKGCRYKRTGSESLTRKWLN